MEEVLEPLRQRSDPAYAGFMAGLIPNLDPKVFLGVRMPELRSFVRTFKKEEAAGRFMEELPHFYYEENMVHALLLCEIRDFDLCRRETERFLPYIDNWAVCDSLSPKCFKKNRSALLEAIRIWTADPHAYTCRFGIGMLMKHFLDADFRPEYLKIPASVEREAYYVRMMQAWFYATALSKQWEDTLPVLTREWLPVWTHNKTIQKACESLKITAEQKKYLRTLKR